MTEPRSTSHAFPDGGWDPKTPTVPSTVHLAGNLLCVNSGLTLLMSFFLLAARSQSILGLLIVLVTLAVAVLQLRTGVLLRQLVPWGRAAGIVLSAVAVLLQIPGASNGLVPLLS